MPNNLPDNLVPCDSPLPNFNLDFNSSDYKNYAANQAKEDILHNLKTIDSTQYIQSPEERLHFLTKQLDGMKDELIKQTNSLEKVRYENTKLNAQIEVLNKTIDSSNEKLDELQAANIKLKIINETLEKNNAHYWRNVILTGFIVGIFTFILGMFTTEAKTLLQLVLNLLP